MAERVAQAIPGLRVAGLDMLLPRDGKGDAPMFSRSTAAR